MDVAFLHARAYPNCINISWFHCNVVGESCSFNWIVSLMFGVGFPHNLQLRDIFGIWLMVSGLCVVIV